MLIPTQAASPHAPAGAPTSPALFSLLPHYVDPDAHFLSLDGANALHTPGLREAWQALEHCISQQTILCICGPSGTGKTFASRALLPALAPDNHHHLLLRAHPDPADLRFALHHALDLDHAPPKDPGVADALIGDALRDQRPVLVVDEAQQLSDACFEYVRHLFDTTGGLTVMLIAGDHGERVLAKQRMLNSRTGARLALAPLHRRDITLALRNLHPLWQPVPSAALHAADARYGQGSLRRWACLTRHAQRALARTDRTELTPALLITLIDRLTSHR
ncbi:ATP-binding protein [Streptomyces sp. NPDC005096]|uniref:ATP-binding protein n=1 Tax=Streptomyces sp. NPDC005096 TaxID=3154559 RepID=UPI0033B21215